MKVSVAHELSNLIFNVQAFPTCHRLAAIKSLVVITCQSFKHSRLAAGVESESKLIN